MTCVDNEFFIKNENKAGALLALKCLSSQNRLDWTSQGEIKKSRSLKGALEECRWDIDFDEEDNVIEIDFTGEKLGSDEAIFNAIAPFVKEGSFIEMRGEDGEMWRWVFENGNCKEVKPKIKW